jgi:transposase
MQQGTTIAVDLAKSVFEVAVSERPGRVSRRHRLTRQSFARFLAEEAPSTIVMEACGTAHHWGRAARARGHDVRLLPPREVARYRRGNKTDRSDAKALLEADRNEDLHPVAIKSVDQQVLVSLHRLRSAWVTTRTARLNTLRGLLRELGQTIPMGARQVVPRVRELLAGDEIPVALRPVLASAADEIMALATRIAEVESQLEGVARASERIRRLRTVPGVGLLTATAIPAMVDLSSYPSGRHFSSSLGITPRESSSGHVRRLGRITKRGDPYLRTLLIHGARSVLHHAKRQAQPDRLQSWALEKERTRGHNKAAVAVANKLARIVWAVGVREQAYRSAPNGTRR